MRRTQHGFTLMELLVVVVVLGVLAALAVPRYLRTVDERYRREAKDTLEEIYAANAMFRQENGRYTNNMAQLPVQDPNSRGANYPLNFTLAGTADQFFQAQADYTRRPGVWSRLQYDPSAPPATRRTFIENPPGWR